MQEARTGAGEQHTCCAGKSGGDLTIFDGCNGWALWAGTGVVNGQGYECIRVRNAANVGRLLVPVPSAACGCWLRPLARQLAPPCAKPQFQFAVGNALVANQHVDCPPSICALERRWRGAGRQAGRQQSWLAQLSGHSSRHIMPTSCTTSHPPRSHPGALGYVTITLENSRNRGRAAGRQTTGSAAPVACTEVPLGGNLLERY